MSEEFHRKMMEEAIRLSMENIKDSGGPFGAVRPKKTYLTHVTHDLMHGRINEALPKGIEIAYDNLKLKL